MRWTTIHEDPIPSDLPDRLLRIAQTAQIAVDGYARRVGLVRSGAVMLVVLPKFYDAWLPKAIESTIGDHGELLERVLARYEARRRRIDEELIGGQLAFARGDTLGELEALRDLLADFLQHGLLKGEKRILSEGPDGDLDWAATLQRAEWFSGAKDGSPFPAKLFFRGEREQRNDAISQLHLAAVELARRIAGLAKTRGVHKRQSRYQATVDSILRLLRRERGRSFRRRDKKVLALLERIVLGHQDLLLGSSGMSESFYSLVDFQYVWEDILRTSFVEESIDLSLPAGGRYVKGNWTLGIRPEPDVILSLDDEKRQIAILDGKYYREVGGSAGDHYKQIIYGQLLGSEGFSVRRNLLVFPSMVREADSVVSTISHHRWKALAGSDVYEASADYLALARAYVGRRRRMHFSEASGDK